MEGRKWLDRVKRVLGRPGRAEPQPDWPVWYAEYWRACHPPADRRTELQTTDVTILDLETTGLDPESDKILSVGALRCRGNTLNVRNQFEAYLANHPARVNAEAVAIHGIIPNSARYDYTDEPAFLRAILDYVGTSILVGHHVGFDLDMLNRALAAGGAGPLQNRVLDTSWLAQRVQPSGYWSPRDQYTLDSLARRYRIPLSDRHTALGDAFITGVLYLKLMGKLEAKLGRPVRIGDLFSR